MKLLNIKPSNMKLSKIGLMLSLLLAVSAAAATPMKPGLWQHKMSFKSEGGEMEQAMEQLRQQLEAMPAAQRDMMRNMMKQQGVDFDFSNQSFKTCLSQAQAERGDFSLSENSQCEQSNKSTSGGVTTMNFSCNESGNTSQGTITLHSDTRYSGESQTTMDFQGKPQKMTATHEGEWLGSDCGDIKPQ